jgi:hypothetical protein
MRDPARVPASREPSTLVLSLLNTFYRKLQGNWCSRNVQIQVGVAPEMGASKLGAVLLLLVASRQAAAQVAPSQGTPPVLGSNTQCRYAPTATHDFCGLPVSLANFQGASPPLQGASILRVDELQ